MSIDAQWTVNVKLGGKTGACACWPVGHPKSRRLPARAARQLGRSTQSPQFAILRLWSLVCRFCPFCRHPGLPQWIRIDHIAQNESILRRHDWIVDGGDGQPEVLQRLADLD